MSILTKSATSTPIEQVYSGVFPEGTGTNVSLNKIHGIPGSYQIDPFSEKDRNHYESRGEAKIKYLIMHYTTKDFESTINIFTSSLPERRTSAHFVITEKEERVSGGKLLQVVPEDMLARHAGVTAWEEDRNLNATSLGIEHVNKGPLEGEKDEGVSQNKKYCPFDEDQIHTSAILSKDIIKRYNILPQHVLGHADIAPGRRADPGPLFPWGELYRDYGIGAWLGDDEMTKDAIIQKYHPQRPYPTKVDCDIFLQILTSYGYCRERNVDSNIIRAFKAHFSANQHPELCDDNVREEDMFWAWALEAKYRSNNLE